MRHGSFNPRLPLSSLCNLFGSWNASGCPSHALVKSFLNHHPLPLRWAPLLLPSPQGISHHCHAQSSPCRTCKPSELSPWNPQRRVACDGPSLTPRGCQAALGPPRFRQPVLLEGRYCFSLPGDVPRTHSESCPRCLLSLFQPCISSKR